MPSRRDGHPCPIGPGQPEKQAAAMDKRERVGDREGEGDGRQRLLDAARDLFLARGYAAVSIGEIAAAAGVSRAAPYYHFKDKEDLFVQIFVREMDRTKAAIGEIIRSDLSFRERLERIIVF